MGSELPNGFSRHRGHAWNNSVNQDQIRDWVGLMGKLVPRLIEIRMDNHGTLWGDACNPVVT